jgi:hypothetical protein
VPSADVEKQVIFSTLVVDVFFAVNEETTELAEGFLRQDRLDLVRILLTLSVARHADEGKAMPVGRHETHLVRLQDEEGAIQKITGVFAGDRKLRLGDHLLHR